MKPYLNRKPYFHVNQPVKKIEVDPFKQRGHKHRFSKDTYRITHVLDDAVPIAYYISDHGKKLFYKEELTPVLDEYEMKKSLVARRILKIISSKRFATKWLRSGKAIEYETKYLVKTNENEQTHYISKEEIDQYDNGPEAFSEFQIRQNGRE